MIREDGNNMNPTLWIYIIYGMVSVGLTVWLARTFFANGTVLLEDVFADNSRFAEAINRMLEVGFYMLNLGYAFTILNRPTASDATGAASVLIQKLGLLLLALGIIHFANMLVFWQIRKRQRLEAGHVPVHA